jgi:hypothetical protein
MHPTLPVMVWRREVTGRLVALSEAEDLCTEVVILREDLLDARAQLAATRARTTALLHASHQLSAMIRTRGVCRAVPDDGIHHEG